MNFERFELYMLNGLEWQQIAAMPTPNGAYRVEITWALDHYRITVIETKREVVVRRVKAFYAHTAIERANKFLRQFKSRGESQ
jgi:hypothetical protein